MKQTFFKFFIKLKHKKDNRFEQIAEEENLKTKILELLNEEDYKFFISKVKE